MKKNSTLLLAIVAVGLTFTAWYIFERGSHLQASAHPEAASIEQQQDLASDGQILGFEGDATPQRSTVPEEPALPEVAEVEAEAPPKAIKRKVIEQGVGALEVSVFDAAGQPIVGARVYASDISESRLRSLPGAGLLKKGTTDERGIAWLTDLPMGLLRVVARSKDLAPGTTDIVTLTSANPSAQANIVLREGGAAEGLVRDLEGAAAAGVRVSMHLRAWADALDNSRPSVMQSMKTAPDGTFRFEHLTPGGYTLYTRADGERRLLVPRQSVDVEIFENQTTQVLFKDSSASYVRLSGVVLRNGEPFSGARLSLGWAERGRGYLGKKTKTDELGRFRIILDEGGDYRFQISGKDGSVFHEVHVPSVAEHEVEIAFNTGSIRGHLLGPQGHPLVGIKITAFGRCKPPGEGTTVAHANSDGEGAFEFPHLLCATYSLSALVRDHSPDPLAPDPHPHVKTGKVSNLSLGPGEELADVDILLGGAAAIEGLVVDSQGDPALASQIQCRAVRYDRFNYTTWKVGPKGNYLAGGLKQGDYLVRAIQQRHISDWVQVTTQLNTTVRADLELEAGTILKVTASANGQPVPRCFVRITDSEGRILNSTVLKNGSSQLGPLYPGTYKVTASLGGKTKLKVHQTVSVAGEPSASIDLLLQ